MNKNIYLFFDNRRMRLRHAVKMILYHLMNMIEPVRNEASIPQGNHDYDDVIMEWHRKYNVIPLYIFDDRDYYWSVTGDVRWYYDAEKDQTMAGYKIVPGRTGLCGAITAACGTKSVSVFP